MLDKYSIDEPQDVCCDPAFRLTMARKASVNDHNIAFGDDRSSLKRMGIMSRLQEQLKPSSHSTIALLAETSS